MDWTDFPAEVRFIILRNLAQAVVGDENDTLSAYAPVCREWQDLAERQTFKSIMITQREITDFDCIFQGRRRRWLQHLQLHIRLPAYPSRRAGMPELDREKDKNDDLYTNGIWNLFEILGKWKKSEVWHDGDISGLKLELSVASPSDPKEYRYKGSLASAMPRFLSSYLDLDFSQAPDFVGPHGLPLVDIISGLCVLRRTRRFLEPRGLLTIMSSLPGLDYLIFEPWQQEDPNVELDYDREIARTMPFWPSSIKTLRIFKTFGAFPRDKDEKSMELCPALGHNLRQLSLQLEHLFCSNCADARSFFGPFYKPQTGVQLPQWKHLRALTITSTLLAADQDHAAINDLLVAAGRAARSMPRLGMMELYNADYDSAAVFTYCCNLKSPGPATAKWTSTWELKVTNGVKTTWRNMVRDVVVRRKLDFEDEKRVRNHKDPSDFIGSHVLSAHLLVHPASASETAS